MQREKEWKDATATFLALSTKIFTGAIGNQRKSPEEQKSEADAMAAALEEKRQEMQNFVLQLQRQILPWMGTCDRCEAAFTQNQGSPQEAKQQATKLAVDDFERAASNFKRTAEPVMQRLTGLINLNKEENVKKTMLVALRVLKTQIDSIVANNTAFITKGKSAVANEGKVYDAQKATAENLLVNVRGAIARALVGAQKLKADPTAANYNAVMPKIGRDVTQQLANVKKLGGKGYDVSGPKNVDSILKPLVPFGDGD